MPRGSHTEDRSVVAMKQEKKALSAEQMPQANYIIFAGDIKMDGSRFLSPLSMKCSEE